MLPQAWFDAFAAYLATVGLGTAVGLAGYLRLLRRLREHHPELYRELGSPRIRMASPRRSLQLQRFLYTRGIHHRGDSELRRTSRFLAVFTPLLLIAVLVTTARWLAVTLRVLP